MKSGSFNLLEPLGPLQAFIVIALLLLYGSSVDSSSVFSSHIYVLPKKD
jgi:hypothetical protein